MTLIKYFLPLSLMLQIAGGAFAVEKDQLMLTDLQRNLMPDKMEVLLAGEREVALLINESTTPITRGVAVLVGETGYSPLSQHSLAPLAGLLNDYGWVTMIMATPSTGFFNYKVNDTVTTPPQGDSQTTPQANADQTGTEQPEEVHPKQGLVGIEQDNFDRQEQQLLIQLEAVVQRTQQYPGFFLVIAQGTSAAWLSKLYSEKQLDVPDAMVIVSPFWPDRKYNKLLPELIAKTEFPVLDVYSPWDNDWSLETYDERRIAATKGLKLHYRQRELIGQAIDAEQYKLLSKEIYGWLTHMGW